MAGERPIHDLPKLGGNGGSFSDRIKTPAGASARIEAGEVHLPARANNRSVTIKMDGPLFVPQASATDKAARLTTFQEGRRWGRSYVIWDSNTTNMNGIEDGRLQLQFPDPANLFSFTDISFVIDSSGWRTPWYSLTALTNRMRDKNGNLVYMPGSPRIQGLEVGFTGDPLTLVKGPQNIKRVYVR